MPVKMTPLETSARDAILVGDPRRAFALAQELTEQPRMSHQARGLWGYTGTTADGRDLTVQATGSGGPSAVPVIGDLAAQGAKRMIRLGTCLGLEEDLSAGTVLVVERIVAFDGTSRALTGGSDFLTPDPDLLAALAGLGRDATVMSHDLVARHEPGWAGQPIGPRPVVARDLQTAATLAMCQRLEVPSAALLIVAEDRSGLRLDEVDLWDRFREVGKSLLSRL